MRKELDCRGMAGADAVAKVRHSLVKMQKGTLKVMVNSPAAQEAISNLEKELCAKVKVDEIDGGYMMWLTRQSDVKACKKNPKKHTGNFVLYLSSDSMGKGDGEFGISLMEQFLETLRETGPIPDTIVCVNSAVLLATEGSTALAALKELEEMGVDIFSSTRSLSHYGMQHKLLVGSTLTMVDIVAAFAEADTIWRP